MNNIIQRYCSLITAYITNNYKQNFREPESWIKYPFLVPGANYSKSLWDWDSWLTGEALLELDDETIIKYQKGCILNFLDHTKENGMMPILIQTDNKVKKDFSDNYVGNIHKPCIAQHALSISKKINDVEWLRPHFNKIEKFIEFYEINQFDKESGLYFWIDDTAIGFDNDPTVFYRPNNSTGAIYLNSMMYKELLAISELAEMFGNKTKAEEFKNKAETLKLSIQKECFDNVDCFFYSVDLSLRKVDPTVHLHSGQPRFWHSLPIKITTWAGLMPLWAEIATKEQAELVLKHYLDKDGLNSKFGVRSVSKKEKMYGIFNTGNPSCWLGPVWIVANYMAYEGFKNYGFVKEAKELAIKTITLLGEDLEKNGEFHEYYDGDTGLGVRGKGFQSWNFLVIKMIKDLSE